MSTFVYGATGLQFFTPGEVESPSTGLMKILSAIAATILALTFLLRFIFITLPIRANRLTLSNPKDLRAYLTVQIAIFALCESVAIFGLCLRLMGTGTGIFVGFLAVAAIGLFIHAPTQLRSLSREGKT